MHKRTSSMLRGMTAAIAAGALLISSPSYSAR
jgi:hypothetical protein